MRGFCALYEKNPTSAVSAWERLWQLSLTSWQEAYRFIKQNNADIQKVPEPWIRLGDKFFLERITRFELATHSLGSYCSTTELYPQYVLPIYYITNHQKGQGESAQAAQKKIFQKHEEYCIQNTKRCYNRGREKSSWLWVVTAAVSKVKETKHVEVRDYV